MSAATTLAIGWLMLSPIAAPVPADPPPDPLGRGYLGAYFATDGTANSLTIDKVDNDTPAQKAGIMRGDVIVRFGSAEPKTFEELRLHIMAYRPGATVEIELSRNGERKTVKATLMPRPPSADRTPSPIPDIPDDK